MSKKICIDAGHYGKQNRSPAVPEYYESDFTWKFHLLLKEALESYGFDVRTTRADKDRDMGLMDRGRASRGCDLFLSIHSNAVDGNVHEGTDYPLACATICGRVDNLADKLKDIVRDAMQTAQPGQRWSKVNSRGKDWYGVLRGAAEVGVPGIILEHSFHTCTRAAQWLSDDENLVKLAQAEAEAIAGFYGVQKPTSAPDTQMYRVRKSWGDAKSQIGAYRNLENAKKACSAGYYVFDTNGNAVYPEPAKKEEKMDIVLKTRLLHQGTRGKDVLALQYALAGRGLYNSGLDGIFGAGTLRAVKAFQKSEGLEVDGYAGPATQSHLLGLA